MPTQGDRSHFHSTNVQVADLGTKGQLANTTYEYSSGGGLEAASPLAKMSEPAPDAPAAAVPAAAAATAAASSSEDDAAATEPSGQQQQELHSATSEMLAKMSKYVEGEAELSTEDYRLLQAMNITAADKYSEMAGYAAGLVAFAEQLDGKYRELAPQLAQIDAMESQVGELEGAVAQLDAYSRRLEAKFQSLDGPG